MSPEWPERTIPVTGVATDPIHPQIPQRIPALSQIRLSWRPEQEKIPRPIKPGKRLEYLGRSRKEQLEDDAELDNLRGTSLNLKIRECEGEHKINGWKPRGKSILRETFHKIPWKGFTADAKGFAARNSRGKFQGRKGISRFPEQLRIGFPEGVSLSQGFVGGYPTLPKGSAMPGWIKVGNSEEQLQPQVKSSSLQVGTHRDNSGMWELPLE